MLSVFVLGLVFAGLTFLVKGLLSAWVPVFFPVGCIRARRSWRGSTAPAVSFFSALGSSLRLNVDPESGAPCPIASPNHHASTVGQFGG